MNSIDPEFFCCSYFAALSTSFRGFGDGIFRAVQWARYHQILSIGEISGNNSYSSTATIASISTQTWFGSDPIPTADLA